MKYQGLLLKNGLRVQSQSGNAYNTSKPIRFKTSMLRSDLCDYSDAYLRVKGTITVTDPNNNANFDRRRSKITHHLFRVFQKLAVN